MKNKTWKVITTAALLTAFLAPAAQTAPAHADAAAASVKTASSAYINNTKAQGKVLLRQGTIFVTLNDLKSLGLYKFHYNNKSKTVTIQSQGTKVVLTAGKSTISVNGKETKLQSAPFIQDGRTMFPLRAASEAFGAEIYWNNHTKTAYIGKQYDVNVSHYEGNDLAASRNAALQLPRISKLAKAPLESTYMEMQGQDYIFQQGHSDKFFEVDNDLISYYEITDHIFELKWQAKMDMDKSTGKHSKLFFLPSLFKQEIGTQPDVQGWTVAKFQFRYPVGMTFYSLFDNKQQLASGEVEHDTSSPHYLGVIVDIPEESQK
ncbi:copper amine oxidase N-terminal domain-containing protein [Paenibacillus lemnae]|uniref:Copper amine oxidase N-terminal domain-containing protein n=1 Tax=Paenibacillus lemnae TaxID=1330551 RepID=A0A848M8B6_PAELE|nr:copper amine oxidase N-terminal domain-containing protein [Paenibacillus lemnae]NMO96133.1 copper amine oxidase N-terminal domain-containing protein [Paenibacillus lemnae]